MTNTKTFFAALIKSLKADCVCDIGSRDGDQALLFRHLRSTADVFAFEANPINYKAMVGNSNLMTERVQIFPYAITNVKGTAKFHVTDVDYSSPDSNKGTSSLLLSDEVRIRETVQVECRRIDEFILSHSPESRSIGLWIDVEGAEFAVLEGISEIKERVFAVHAESAEIPIRHGQRTLAELVALMRDFGFLLCASNIRPEARWGDVVFVNRAAIEALGFRFSICKLKGRLSFWFPVDRLAVFLKARFPAAYRTLRRVYLTVGT